MAGRLDDKQGITERKRSVALFKKDGSPAMTQYDLLSQERF
jgi:hypothetical protein